ncbi:MAG TPA: hypothetical protein ENN17_12935 [bacterium]|nr:hypothetical protein [bacterium]
MRRYGLIAGFRLLLWWGVRSLKRWTGMPERHAIEQFRPVRTDWPDAAWIFADERAACLAYDPDPARVRIVITETVMN